MTNNWHYKEEFAGEVLWAGNCDLVCHLFILIFFNEIVNLKLFITYLYCNFFEFVYFEY